MKKMEEEDDLRLLASVVIASDPPGRPLRRAGLLTPYLLETIAEDARRAGPGGSLAVTVPNGTGNEILGRVRRRLEALSRGLRVDVSEDNEPAPH